MQGTFGGAICHNGNLYCPATPRRLLELGPLSRSASLAEEVAHDRQSAELSRYKLGRISSDDGDGFHRVMCPAVMGKLRCPNRETSMALGFDHAQVQQPPEPRPLCCVQQTLTVPPEVNAKTAQKHDYPSRAHRLSFARRTSVERSYSTLKDPASTDTTRGWCRVMGLCAITMLLACSVVVRNLRILDAFDVGQQQTSRRQTRARRRRTLQELADPAHP